MLPDSTNPRVMADNIRRLQTEVENAVELPSVETTDEGKVLTVNSSGKWAALDPASQLPDYDVGDSGKFLGVDSSGDLEFSNPPGKYNLDYSTTEIDTGKKWIDNRNIFRRVLEGDFPVIETATQNYVFGIIENVSAVDFNGVLTTSAGISQSLGNFAIGINEQTGNIYVLGLPNTFSEGHYFVIIEYVKNPAPGEETKKSTKRKITKGEN